MQRMNMEGDLYKKYRELGIEVSPIFSELKVDVNGSVDHFSNFVIYTKKNYSLVTNSTKSTDKLSDTSWEDASGVGLLLGKKNVRCLKLKNAYSSDVQLILSSLGLPLNYQWIFTGASGDYYIIFRANKFLFDYDIEQKIRDFNEYLSRNNGTDLVSGLSKVYLGYNSGINLELIWDFTVIHLPTSIEAPYYLHFLFDKVPHNTPAYLPTIWLNEFLSSITLENESFTIKKEYNLDVEDGLKLGNGSQENIGSENIPYGQFHFESINSIENHLSNIEYRRDMDYSFLYESLFIDVEYNSKRQVAISWIWKCLYTNEFRQGSIICENYLNNNQRRSLLSFIDILREVKVIVSVDLDMKIDTLNQVFEKYNLNKIEKSKFEYAIDLREIAVGQKIKSQSLVQIYNEIFKDEVDIQADSTINVGLIYDSFFYLFRDGVHFDRPYFRSPQIKDFDYFKNVMSAVVN